MLEFLSSSHLSAHTNLRDLGVPKSPLSYLNLMSSKVIEFSKEMIVFELEV
jgi:hypothetical protein